MIAPQFPALDNGTYLNTASSGLLSRSLSAWRRQHDLEFLQDGSLFREHQVQAGLLSQCKKGLANFFHADADNTFLVPNFSYAFNTVLSRLTAGHRFLLLQEEYPSIQHPIENHGATYEQVAVDEQLEERILDAFKQFKPTVFAFSLVQYISGIKINLDFIKQLKADYPDVLLIADGTQYCGTEPFNFEQSGIDVLIASGYKWMLAGYGNGFMFMRDDARRSESRHFQEKSDWSFYMEPGHHDTLAFGSLKFAVHFFEEIDFKQEAARLQQLTTRAKATFIERDLLQDATAKRHNHSTIFNLQGDDALYKRLLAENIACIQRGSGIRVGFHFYNGYDDLERLLEVIDRYR